VYVTLNLIDLVFEV